MSNLETTCEQVQAWLNDDNHPFLLLDCREQDEYDLVHIDGATLLPMSQITERVDEIADHKEKPVVVYCHHGGRSLRVTNWLLEQGFQNALSMAGGIDQWALQIDPSKPRY